MKKSALFLSGIFLLCVIIPTFSCIKGKGDIVIDTFADEKGLYALLSSVLDNAFNGEV